MNPSDADNVSAQVRAVGFDHTRYCTSSGDRIVIAAQKFSGEEILALVGVFAPGGVPITGITVSVEAAGVVIS